MKKSLYLISGLLLLLLAPAMKGQESAPYTRWENFTIGNGMPDDKVFSVAVDGENIWAGTENGLVLIESWQNSKGLQSGRWAPEPSGYRSCR